MSARPDPAADALLSLAAVLRSSADDCARLADRAEALLARRSEGAPWAELAAVEARPLIVTLVTELMDRLADAGAAFRREEALALAGEGLTQERIAFLFGVTRQRVGALLKR
jgi:hypothetical protein